MKKLNIFSALWQRVNRIPLLYPWYTLRGIARNVITLDVAPITARQRLDDGSTMFLRFLSRVAALLCLLLTISVNQMWGADPVASATATSGKSYVIAYWTGSKYVALDPSKVGTSASTFDGTDVSVDGNGKVTTANPPLWTLTVNPSQSTQFYISCVINSTTYYLYKNGTSSTTNYNIKRVASGQHYWTFSKSSNKYSIKSERGSACQYLYYYTKGGKWEVYSTSTASLILLEPAPAITCATTSLSGFTYVQGNGPSSAQSFSVSGSYLTANITVTAPTNYEVSTSSGSGYGSSVTLTKNASGVVSATTVYVRLKSGLSAGSYNSVNVTIASTGATSKTISLSGSVTTTSVSLTKAGQTNGSFTLTQSSSPVTSVTTSSAAQAVTVTATPATGYYLSNLTASNPATGTASVTGSGNTRTVTYTKGANGSSTITATFSPIWYLKGDFNSWGTTDPLTNITSNVATVTKSLSKTTAYEFKVYNAQDDTWYGNNGKIIDDISGWTFSTSEDNCKVFATVADDYTFKFNISNQQMQVIYPDMTHPNDAYVYLTKWWDCYVHWWYTDGSDYALTEWGYDLRVTRETEICGTDYWCVPILQGYPKLIMKDNAGTPSNTTGDQTTTSNAGKYITHDGSWGWHDFATYTITFAGGTGSSGSMSSIVGICPGGSETLPANTFTKTGYTFANWKTNVAVTANSTSVAANGTVPAGATLSSIGSNITLTAQWTANTITLDLKKNNSDASGSSDGSATINYDATATTSITAATRTGYTVEGYYTDAACTAANKVLTDAGAVVSGTVSGYTTSGKWTRATTPTTLYTKWSAKTCTVTFDKNSGTGGSNSVTATYGSAMPDITPPTRSGYIFGGYYDSETSNNGTGTQYYKADGKSAKNWDKNVTSEQTLYARWYGDPLAWCEPDITITGDIHLTSYKDIYVHSTSDAGNLISISSSDFGSATHVEVAYLDADNSDAEVDKEQSVFRLCNDGSVNYNTIDGFDPDYAWGTTHSIKYTPNAYNKYDNYKLQLKIFNGDSIIKTVTHNLYGRSLPQEFVIASKFNGKWYALPNTMGNAVQDVYPIRIFVDDEDTPTSATYASDRSIYKGAARYTPANNVNSIRLTKSGSQWLTTSSTTQLGLNTTAAPAASTENKQVWYLKSSDFGAYLLKMDPSQSPGDKQLGIHKTSGKIGMFTAANVLTAGDIYLLGITNKYTDIDADVTDWTGDDLQVTAAGAAGVSAAKMKVMLEGGAESSAITLSTPATNTYLAKFDGGYDFTGKSGQTLMLKWLNSSGTMVGASMVTMPKIIVTSATSWASISPTPTINDIVVLTKPTTVGATGKAKRVELDKTNSNTGSLDISAAKELIVAETVRKFDGSSFGATGETDITISSTSTLALGALVMGTHDGTNKATVNFYTKSTGKKQENTSVGQYVGTPFNDETNILYNWYNSWVYGIKYTSNVIGWERVEEGSGMDPFKGYCVFSADAWDSGTGHSYWQQGTLVSSDNHTCSSLNYQSGTYTNPNNENLLANSWMAPIKIKAMQSSDFTNTYATVYIFNSTSNSAYSSLAGNYTAHTVGTSEGVIPAMQSFSVFTTGSGASVSLDYNKIVYAPAVAGTASPAVNSAPSRSGRSADEADKMRLFVRSENGCGDMLYMWERADFTEGFENGWDGHKLYGESYAPQLYAITPDGEMAVNCVPSWEGTVLGFKKGTEDNVYTFTFEYEGENTWYLNDLREQTSTLISSESSYMFMASDEDMAARFIISQTPIHSTPTGIEQSAISGQKSAVKKIVIDDHVYIIRNGKMYSAEGVMVR